MSEKPVHIPDEDVTIQPKTEEIPTETGFGARNDYLHPTKARNRHTIFYEPWDGGSSITEKIFEDDLEYFKIMLNNGVISDEFVGPLQKAVDRVKAIAEKLDDPEWNQQMEVLVRSHEIHHKTQHIRFGSPEFDVKGERQQAMRNRFLHDMYKEAQALVLDSTKGNDVSDKVRVDRLTLFAFNQQKDLNLLSSDQEGVGVFVSHLDESIRFHIRTGTHPFAYLTVASGDVELFEKVLSGDYHEETVTREIMDSIKLLLESPEEVLENMQDEKFQVKLDQRLMHYAQLV